MKESVATLDAAIITAASHITAELMRQGASNGEVMTDEFISSAFAQAQRSVLLGCQKAQEHAREMRRAKAGSAPSSS